MADAMALAAVDTTAPSAAELPAATSAIMSGPARVPSAATALPLALTCTKALSPAVGVLTRLTNPLLVGVEPVSCRAPPSLRAPGTAALAADLLAGGPASAAANAAALTFFSCSVKDLTTQGAADPPSLTAPPVLTATRALPGCTAGEGPCLVVLAAMLPRGASMKAARGVSMKAACAAKSSGGVSYAAAMRKSPSASGDAGACLASGPCLEADVGRRPRLG